MDRSVQCDSALDAGDGDSPMVIRVLTLVGVIAAVATLVSTVRFGVIQSAQQPVDYVSFWAAGDLVNDGQPEAVYDLAEHNERSTLVVSRQPEFLLPYLLPPTFLPFASGLAAIGYTTGFLLLAAVGAAATMAMAFRITNERLSPLLAFGSPTTLANLQIGQLGLVLGAAAAVALDRAERRPWMSGVALAVLSLKPQLGLGIGLALLVARQWRALSLGLGGSVILLTGSTAVVGIERWQEWLDMLRFVAGPLTSQHRIERPFEGQAVSSVLQSGGLPTDFAWAAHVAIAALIASVVLVNVRRHGLGPTQKAAVLAMTIVVSPRSFGYDFAMLVPAAAWLVRSPVRSKGSTQWALVAVAGMITLALRDMPLAVPASLVILWLAGFGSSSATPTIRSAPATQARRDARTEHGGRGDP